MIRKGVDKKVNTTGFTLIELLVVIAIIGILSSIVLVALNGARDKARDARIIADMSQLRSVAEMLYDSDYDAVDDQDLNGDYTDSDIASLDSDVDDQDGNDSSGVTIYADDGEPAYCAFSTLNGGNDYCIDSTGAAREVSDADASAGCDNTTFVCPSS